MAATTFGAILRMRKLSAPVGPALALALVTSGCLGVERCWEVVVDGRFSPGEWTGTRSELIGGGAELLLDDDGSQILVGVRLPERASRYVDLYVRNGGGRIINFHASLRQGERVLAPGWTDRDPPFTWEPTSGWTSSIAPRITAPRSAAVADQLGPFGGYEMRIPARLIGVRPWRLRIEVRDFTSSEPDWIYPAGSARGHPSTWALVN